jgi:hypothetical protein
VEITRTSKFHPRTKHLNVKLHRKEISINPISAAEQLADYLTKPVNINILHKLRTANSDGLVTWISNS